jgi:SAM-dependent methyltransferase
MEQVLSTYYDTEAIDRAVSQNRHRDVIGGLWDEIGKLQFNFLRANQLTPGSRFIDVGCGCLRGGVFFVEYLDPGNYYGIDISQSLLDAGYDIELKGRGVQDKLPRRNLICDGEFQFSRFSTSFDMGIAQSLFTHLPINHIQLWLSRLHPYMSRDGVLFATFFLVPDKHPFGAPFDHPHGVRTFDHKDPYHYRFGQIRHFCNGLPWFPVLIGNWGHPRDQQMVSFQISSIPARDRGAWPKIDWRALVSRRAR